MYAVGFGGDGSGGDGVVFIDRVVIVDNEVSVVVDEYVVDAVIDDLPVVDVLVEEMEVEVECR